ncbi:FHA domain-containing protein [Glaciihabitans sp. UYNi722]|uniref:FHA domain-containing protein FhaB/FipA n=1 Tax=Glaciihabitans sp. UYNi722 TaxID=3156344 RepID=UPI00339581A2
MSELTLLLLRFGFLIVLWAFVFAVVYALRTDLFGQRTRKLPAESGNAAPFVAAAVAPPTFAASNDLTQPVSTGGNSASATRLVITSGPKQGLELTLPREPLTIGRSGESGLVIRDDYTSTHHARLMLWSDDWVIQDLDSTNGTFLDGTRVTLPTPVPLNTPVRIGTTSFELRR